MKATFRPATSPFLAPVARSGQSGTQLRAPSGSIRQTIPGGHSAPPWSQEKPDVAQVQRLKKGTGPGRQKAMSVPSHSSPASATLFPHTGGMVKKMPRKRRDERPGLGRLPRVGVQEDRLAARLADERHGLLAAARTDVACYLLSRRQAGQRSAGSLATLAREAPRILPHRSHGGRT